MKQLFISEWQRLWHRKSTWISFLLIPIIILATLRNYILTDAKITPDNIKYVSSLNFPSTILGNQSTEFFDVIVILLIIMAVTSEYRQGHLRMVMIRSFSFDQIFKAKYLVILSTSFLLLFVHFILSTLFGYLYLPNKEVKFPYQVKKFTMSESIFYNAKYYILAFIVLAAVISVIMCISIICKTTVGALAASIIFIYVSSIVPDLCSTFMPETSQTYKFVSSTFLASIQYAGIDELLSGISGETILMLTSIVFHIVVFYLIALNIFSEQDCYI